MSKLRKIFNGQNSIASATGILIVTLFLSNILGVIRDHYLTQKIPTEVLSTYYSAFRIPDLLLNILILGGISSAFIPVFTSYISRHKVDEAWKVAASIINVVIILLILICLVLAIFMPYIIPMIVPGFTNEVVEVMPGQIVGKIDLTVSLARLLLISPILFGLSYIFGAVLNSYKRFMVYSLSPLVYNLSIIFGIIFLADRYSIYGVVLGLILGAFLHMIIQLPVMFALGFRYRFFIDLTLYGVKRIGRLMLPRSIGLGANQVLLLVFTSIASGLGGLAIAVYNLADNIQTMPSVVFGTSFATAVFPKLAESAALKNWPEYRRYFNKTLRVILFFLLPMTFGVILLRAQIVRLILGSGHFGWEQTILTANTLGFFALGLVFAGLVPLFARGFYAIHNTKTPMYITIASIIISIIFAYILKNSMGIVGLSLAYTFGSFFNATLLYIFLRKKVELADSSLTIFLVKIFLSSFVMAAAIFITKYFVSLFVDMNRVWGIATQTLSALIVAILVYFLLSWSLGCEEISSMKIIFKRFKRTPIEIPPAPQKEEEE